MSKAVAASSPGQHALTAAHFVAFVIWYGTFVSWCDDKSSVQFRRFSRQRTLGVGGRGCPLTLPQASNGTVFRPTGAKWAT